MTNKTSKAAKKPSTINRRHLLGGALIGAAASGILSGRAPAIAKNRQRLKMVTAWPKNFPGLGTAAENIARRIKLLSDNVIDVRVYAAGEFVGAFEAFDAVSTGTADMYNGAEFYWQGKSPAFNFFAATPFGFTAEEQNAWINFGGGRELWDELSARFNIKAFQSANTGLQAGGWFNREINSVEDFKGLKMRIPGLGGEVLRRLGAAAVSLPGSEIFPAMKSGAIDATEWVGPWNDLAFGFHQVGKYYYTPGFQEPSAALSTGVNLDTWNNLSKSQQDIIRVCCAAENDHSLSAFAYNNSVALKTLIKKHNIEIRQFSPEIMRTLRRTSQAVLQDIARKDAFTNKVYQSYRETQELLAIWSQNALEPYLKARS